MFNPVDLLRKLQLGKTPNINVSVQLNFAQLKLITCWQTCLKVIETKNSMLTFFKFILTSMLRYKIATLHAKSFLLQSPVTLINTEYIHYLTESSFVVTISFTNCPNVSFLLLKIFCEVLSLKNFKIYSSHNRLNKFCILIC
jgi:hypothetical protein